MEVLYLLLRCFAAALKDHKRALVIGNTTFGKGSVQTIFPLKNIGGALKLTISYFFSPLGYWIHIFGIELDIIISKFVYNYNLYNYFNKFKKNTIFDYYLYEALCLLKRLHLFSFLK